MKHIERAGELFGETVGRKGLEHIRRKVETFEPEGRSWSELTEEMSSKIAELQNEVRGDTTV